MQPIVLLNALFASLVLGCPPPLNNFNFLGNTTHTTADLNDAAANRLGAAWTEVVTFGGNPHTRWPRNPLTQYTSPHYLVEQGMKLLDD
jgi:hypothetical protein